MSCKKIGVELLTIGNLPTSYSVSMSYEEQLLWILNKIEKEIIPSINNLTDIINNIDLNFDEVNEKIDNLQTQVNNDVALINQELSRLNNTVLNISDITEQNSEDIIRLNNKINTDIGNLNSELRNLIASNYDTLKTYVDYQDNILNEKIDNIQIGAIDVYDPTTGTIEPLQIVINNLYQLTNKDGLTAGEFDGLELTATEFDAYQITAYEFDSQGKVILV